MIRRPADRVRRIAIGESAAGELTHQGHGKREPRGLEHTRVHGHPSEFAGHQRRAIGAALASGVFDNVAERGKHGGIAEAG